MGGMLERARPGSAPSLPGTKRARLYARAVLLPLLAAATVLVPAVAAQAVPAQGAARHLSASASSRPSLAGPRHRGNLFVSDPRLPAGGPDPAAGAGSGPFGSFGSALVGTAPVSSGPAGVAVDAATDTIYVASGNNADGPNQVNPPNTISVVNGRHCQASDVSRCKGPWPTVKVGNLASAVTVDQGTDTVYVTNVGDNTVSVIDGATCNALVSSGCDQRPATVPVGGGPAGIFADHTNHTVYVANFNDHTVSMIDSAICTGSHLGGCPSQPPPTVAVGGGPGDVDVNEVTHTVYVTTLTGLSVFAENTCNAAVQSGCASVGEAVAPGIGTPACINNVIPSCGGFSAKVDPDNNTIYEADGTTTVTVFDGRTCQASDLAGCAAQMPGTVTVAPPADQGFEVAIWVAVDAPLHTVYAVDQRDDDVSAIDANVCDGRHLSACASLQPPLIHTGEDPESVALNPDTQTLYTANQVSNDVSVINASQCNATTITGCRKAPPAVTLPEPGPLAADPAIGTVYVTTGTNTVSMINSQTCNVADHQGCTPTPPTVTVGAGPAGIAVNQQTHTAYVANFGSGKTGSVSVLDDQTCDATTTTGCKNTRTLQVPGGNASAIAVNPATDTIYVIASPASGPSTVSVFNGATCNAIDGSGCGQAPHSVTVGFGASALGVNVRTDTIYVANFNDQNNTPYAGNTVSVINGTTCNATTTTGCGNAPKTITLGPPYTSPAGVAIDQATDTIYVADNQNGEGSGTVSVINGAICNAAITTGCGQTPPTVRVGFGPAAIAFNPANRTIVVTNIEDTSISVIDAATCNAVITSNCSLTQPKFPVGRAPAAVAVNPAAGTVYVSNGDGTVSIIPAVR
jgi:YVTN family beta-propeller protein